MLSYAVDIGVVGDKLQSLSYEENVFTCLSDISIPNISIIKPKAENKNRRIKVKGLARKINEIIDFSKYGLPEISVENEEELGAVDKPFEILKYNDTIYMPTILVTNLMIELKFCATRSLGNLKKR